MKCSVIVTAYNQENTINETLDSILSQKCNFEFEIIVGDDFSTDQTRDICLEYKNRFPDVIQLIFQTKNMGVGANFALCVKKAKGKFIAICAADDFWQNPNKLELQIDYLEKNPDIGILYTDYNKLLMPSGKIIYNFLKTTHQKIYTGTGLFDKIFRSIVPILTLTVMFRKELFDKYIPVDDYIRLQFPLEDWPTWIILSQYTLIGYLPISTATYRYGHDSISNMLSYQKIDNRFSKDKVMIQYICDMFPEIKPFSDEWIYEKVNSVKLNLAYKKKDYSNAKIFAQKLSECGFKNVKVIMARNYFLFEVFALFKYMKFKIVGH